LVSRATVPEAAGRQSARERMTAARGARTPTRATQLDHHLHRGRPNRKDAGRKHRMGDHDENRPTAQKRSRAAATPHDHHGWRHPIRSQASEPRGRTSSDGGTPPSTSTPTSTSLWTATNPYTDRLGFNSGQQGPRQHRRFFIAYKRYILDISPRRIAPVPSTTVSTPGILTGLTVVISSVLWFVLSAQGDMRHVRLSEHRDRANSKPEATVCWRRMSPAPAVHAQAMGCAEPGAIRELRDGPGGVTACGGRRRPWPGPGRQRRRWRRRSTDEPGSVARAAARSPEHGGSGSSNLWQRRLAPTLRHALRGSSITFA
jgi:hypothetical protein